MLEQEYKFSEDYFIFAREKSFARVTSLPRTQIPNLKFFKFENKNFSKKETPFSEYRTLPYRFGTYHFRDLDLKNHGTVAKNRTVLRFL